jgi:hypothetical protein
MAETGWIMPRFYVRRAMKTPVLMVRQDIIHPLIFRMQRKRRLVNVPTIVVNVQKSIVIHRRGTDGKKYFHFPGKKYDPAITEPAEAGCKPVQSSRAGL